MMGTRRIFFTSRKAREDFFANIRQNFDSWNAVAQSFGLNAKTFDNFRMGRVSLPESIFGRVLEGRYYEKHISYKEENWGQRKGGKVTLRRHPEIFEKGRRIGGKSGKESGTKYKFPMDTPLTRELAELVGAFIGDGFTNKYAGAPMIQFTGHAMLDKEYLTSHLTRLVRSICSDIVPYVRKKQNSLWITFYSKEFHALLTERFALPNGKKCYIVKVPEEILNARKNVFCSCLRGIFDTDGYVFFDRRKSYSSPYVRIGLHLRNKGLIKQVHELLQSLNINSRKVADEEKIHINGEEQCSLFMEKIGFSNSRHKNKITRALGGI